MKELPTPSDLSECSLELALSLLDAGVDKHWFYELRVASQQLSAAMSILNSETKRGMGVSKIANGLDIADGYIVLDLEYEPFEWSVALYSFRDRKRVMVDEIHSLGA
jgi:hypothetical protein